MLIEMYLGLVAVGAYVFGCGMFAAAQEENKFSLLDLIKTIGLVFGAPLTLSVLAVEHVIQFIKYNFSEYIESSKQLILWRRA